MNSTDDHLSVFLKGDRPAIEFIRIIQSIAHAWDDLIDRDNPQDDRAVNRAFVDALVTLPRNSFYAQNFQTLNPIVVSSILSWKGATDIERASPTNDELSIALHLRANYIQLVLVSAAIVGGYDHAESHARNILLWGHDESFKDYIAALKKEREARGD